MLNEAGLGRFVVVGGDEQQGVRAGVLGVLGEVEGSGGVVAPRAGNDLHPVVNPLDAEGHGGDVLPDREGGALAGGSADADGIHAVVELLVDPGGRSSRNQWRRSGQRG